MIRVTGMIKFSLDFNLKVDMTEEEWDALSTYQKNEYIDERIGPNDLNSMEVDDCDVWDVDTIKEEPTHD